MRPDTAPRRRSEPERLGLFALLHTGSGKPADPGEGGAGATAQFAVGGAGIRQSQSDEPLDRGPLASILAFRAESERCASAQPGEPVRSVSLLPPLAVSNSGSR